MQFMLWLYPLQPMHKKYHIHFFQKILLFLCIGEQHVNLDSHRQGIFPEVGFTCSGQLLGWVFGAKWEGNSTSFTELQIWRPTSIDGVFTKVGSTTIMTTQNHTDLYNYSLSSPLAFQAGDVLGYYQPPSSESQLRLYYEENIRRKLRTGIYFPEPQSPTTTLDIRNQSVDIQYQMFINVITGEYNVTLLYAYYL